MLEPMYVEKVIRCAQLISGNPDGLADEIRFYAAKPVAFLGSPYHDYATFDYGEPDRIAALPGYPEDLMNTYLGDIVSGILSFRQHLLRVDWRASPENVRWAVETLLERRELPGIDLDFISSAGRLPAGQILDLGADRLEQAGLILAQIADGSDAWQLLVVPAEDLLELLALGSELGMEICTWFD